MSHGFGKQQVFDGACSPDYEDTGYGMVGSGNFHVSVFSVFMALALCGSGGGNLAALCRENRTFADDGGYGDESVWTWNGSQL